MANEEHLRMLVQGVPAWNAWRVTGDYDDPDLIEAHLDGLDLSGVDLSFANLTTVAPGLGHASFWFEHCRRHPP
jgi:hypothetical protein